MFDFQSQAVRFLKVGGVDCAVGVDVAGVLGDVDPSKAVSTNIDPAYKGVTKLVTPGGLQTVAIVFEPGIYQLIFSSKLPLAKEFQRWAFEEVFPSIRKTGGRPVKPEGQQPQTALQVLALSAQATRSFTGDRTQNLPYTAALGYEKI